MKERLTNNLGLKILSIILAIFMWLIMVNVSNPLVEDSQEVQIEMLNEDVLEKANLTYEMVGKKTVTVSYQVRIRDRFKISASDFYAYADLAELYDVTGAIPIKVDVSNYDVRTLIEGTPTAKNGVVRIQTEPLQRKRFDLAVHNVGEPEEGNVLGTIILDPKFVYATGPVSDIGKISSVGVEVNVEGANADMVGVAEVNFYDANGNKLTNLGDDVTLSLKTVSYQVTILKVKSLALDFQVSGQVADGYRFTGVESDIKGVSVEGLRSALASISTLTVPAELLNVSGATGDVNVEVNLAELLPDNITIANDESAIAQITLKVEQLVTREFEYDLRYVDINGQRDAYSYNFSNDRVTLMIRGLEEDLDVLRSEDIALHMDVSAMELGSHAVVFEEELSEGYELMGHRPLLMMVTMEGEEMELEEGEISSQETVNEE